MVVVMLDMLGFRVDFMADEERCFSLTKLMDI